jgi:hypothetical protein
MPVFGGARNQRENDDLISTSTKVSDGIKFDPKRRSKFASLRHCMDEKKIFLGENRLGTLGYGCP